MVVLTSAKYFCVKWQYFIYKFNIYMTNEWNLFVVSMSTHTNKLQWNFDHNSYIFIQENACENVVWKMAVILSRPQCVKHP